MKERGQIITGIDVGTTKVSTLIGVKSGGSVEVIGLGAAHSEGLRKGVVVNLETTVDSIRRSCEEAEKSAGVELRNAYVGLSGSHIKSFNSHAAVVIKNPQEVNGEDVFRVLEKAKAVELPNDREILHVLTQEFIVDDNDGIKDPRGMTGIRLEAKVHVVTDDIPSAKNLVRCVQRSGIDVDDIVFTALASSESVLSPEEKEVGVILMDFGGGTVDTSVFHDGALRHTFVLPIGGAYITGDIAYGMKVPQADAEQIKMRDGCAMIQKVRKDELVEIPGVGGRPPRLVRRQSLAEMVEPRVEEIFKLVYKELLRSGYEELMGAGVVITGGSAHLDYVTDLAERVFRLPVRRGNPAGISGHYDRVDTPSHSTAVGLLLYGARYVTSPMEKERGGKNGRFFGKVGKLIKEFF